MDVPRRARGGGRHDPLRRQAALGISRRGLSERLGHLVEHGVLALQESGDRHVLGDGAVTGTAAATSAEAQLVQDHVGSTVVDIELPSHVGEQVRLRPQDGGWRVAFFFPGAFAPGAPAYPAGWGDIPGAAGCTLESTTYTAHYPAFRAAGADRYKRQTLLIDSTGTVRRAQMPTTDPAGFVTEMLAVVRSLTV